MQSNPLTIISATLHPWYFSIIFTEKQEKKKCHVIFQQKNPFCAGFAELESVHLVFVQYYH